jgi:hypothetical protein
VCRNKNKTYLECRFIAPEQKAAKQVLASIEMSNAPKGQHSVRDVLNIMHNMPSMLNDIGISSRTTPHTTSWTDDRDDHARELTAQQQDFNENPFSDEHLQIQWQ